MLALLLTQTLTPAGAGRIKHELAVELSHVFNPHAGGADPPSDKEYLTVDLQPPYKRGRQTLPGIADRLPPLTPVQAGRTGDLMVHGTGCPFNPRCSGADVRRLYAELEYCL